MQNATMLHASPLESLTRKTAKMDRRRQAGNDRPDMLHFDAVATMMGSVLEEDAMDDA